MILTCAPYCNPAQDYEVVVMPWPCSKSVTLTVVFVVLQ